MTTPPLAVSSVPATATRLHATTGVRAISVHLLLVISLTLLGLGLRLWLMSVNELQPIYSPADDGDYYQRALRLATTGVYLDDFWLIRPPLHVFLFATMIKVSILLGNVDALVLIRLLQITMITATIPMGYDIGRRLFSRTAGVVLAGILAIWYPLLELPIHLFSEPTFFFFLVLHLWLLLRWRDDKRWTTLALAGIAVGYGALSRSPTLYGIPFALLFIVLETHPAPRLAAATPLAWARELLQWWWAQIRERQWWLDVIRNAVVFVAFAVAIVAPWTYRNYVTYGHFIPVDTLGSVNLWLHIEQYPEKGVEVLKTMPQAERHIFAIADTRRIYEADPDGFLGLVWRNAVPHFRHIWKAQFVEDFATKRSLYGRPLRPAMWLGGLGDLIWLAFVFTGLIGLTQPLHPREGAFRLLALAWVSYTIVGMMIFHIEPRYLFPIWLFLMIYGAAALADLRGVWRGVGQHWWHMALAAVVGGGFLFTCFTYRDYPYLISRIIQREAALSTAERAYHAGDLATAQAAYTQALAVHDQFSETRAALALLAIEQGDLDAAREFLRTRTTQHVVLARGMLAHAEGNPQLAHELIVESEKWHGADMQHYMLGFNAPPTRQVDVGTGLDLGYIHGFSSVEQLTPPNGPPITYRWLQGRGLLRVPLSEPIQAGTTLVLHMTAGYPQAVPLTVTFANGTQKRFSVASGVWRQYRLSMPPALMGSSELVLQLDAPIFVPAHTFPDSVDTRPLSLMLDQVRVE